mmetsp:Transcript_499/g.1165  ORF Transcript_499/g.1165 Transcript_499/m.1165 type:complete len:277 (-) Transcript_499:1444-2274(-)
MGGGTGSTEGGAAAGVGGDGEAEAPRAGLVGLSARETGGGPPREAGGGCTGWGERAAERGFSAGVGVCVGVLLICGGVLCSTEWRTGRGGGAAPAAAAVAGACWWRRPLPPPARMPGVGRRGLRRASGILWRALRSGVGASNGLQVRFTLRRALSAAAASMATRLEPARARLPPPPPLSTGLAALVKPRLRVVPSAVASASAALEVVCRRLLSSVVSLVWTVAPRRRPVRDGRRLPVRAARLGVASLVPVLLVASASASASSTAAAHSDCAGEAAG